MHMNEAGMAEGAINARCMPNDETFEIRQQQQLRVRT